MSAKYHYAKIQSYFSSLSNDKNYNEIKLINQSKFQICNQLAINMKNSTVSKSQNYIGILKCHQKSYGVKTK